MLLFRECLKNGIDPVVIEDANRGRYLKSLKFFREEGNLSELKALFETEQTFYWKRAEYFFCGVDTVDK